MISANYPNKVNSNVVESVVEEATGVSSVSKNFLDHFAVRDMDNAEVNVLAHQDFSDHYPISLTFPEKQNWKKTLKISKIPHFQNPPN